MYKYTLFIIVTLLISIGCNHSSKKTPIAKNGVLDLRNWDVIKDGSVTLKGEWEFYWKKLIEPKDFTDDSLAKNYFNVPNVWNNKIIGNIELSGDGYATYRLTILHDTDVDLDLYIGNQLTAYKFWCNDTEMFSCGNVSDNPNLAMPSQISHISQIKLSRDTTQIVFQISNYHHYNGGFYVAPKLGTKDNIRAGENKRFALDIFLIGGILIMTFYHIGIFFFGKGNTASLIFGIFSLVLCFRGLFIGHNFISVISPYTSWSFQYRFKYATIYIAAALLASFVNKIYTKDINNRNTLIYISSNIIAFLTVFLPVKIFTNPIILETIGVVSFVYYMSIFIKNINEKRRGFRIFLGSFVIYLFTIINDIILVKTLFFSTIELIPIGTYLFVLGQSLLYARITISALNENKILSSRLNLNNKKISVINKELESQKTNLIESENRLKSLIKLLPEAIFELDKNGHVTFANDEFYKQLCYVPTTKINFEDLIAKKSSNEVSFIDFIISATEQTKNIRELRVFMTRSDDSSFPASLSISRIYASKDVRFRGIFIDVSERVTDEQIIDDAFTEIRNKNQDIMDSLKYAFTIQTAVMPSSKTMSDIFKEHFVINRPHSIVSGDFYYVNKKSNKIIFALSDCTGHGVPGGFMTMLGITLLNEMYGRESIPSPNETLDKMRESIINGLNQNSEAFGNKEGMDIILFSLDTESLELEFASAGQPLYIIRKEELIIYHGDKMPVSIFPEMKKFTLNKVQLEKDDMLYLFSDGLVDIFGGPRTKRLYPIGLQKIIKQYHSKPMKTQGQLIDRRLKQWQGSNEQIDDMLMVGIKI